MSEGNYGLRTYLTNSHMEAGPTMIEDPDGNWVIRSDAVAELDKLNDEWQQLGIDNGHMALAIQTKDKRIKELEAELETYKFIDCQDQMQELTNTCRQHEQTILSMQKESEADQ